jgi:hypothetical protein
MSSNSQSHQTDMTSAPSVQDRAKMFEDFVNELVVNRDFKLDERGDIAMIRHLHVSKCTVPLLRQICVRFKVSGYKNQTKECTLGLLKNLVTRESLKHSMYDDSASCSSESSSSQEGAPVPRPPKSKSTNKKSSAAEKETSSTVLSPGQSSTSTTTISDHDDAPGNKNSLEEEFHDAEQEELSSSNHEDDTRASLTGSASKKRKVTETTNNGADLSVSKTRGNTPRRKKKKAKGTAPDAVTCINTYFRVINVYMCQRNRSLVMDLGLPPTKANLDSRTSPHRHVYEALLSQYLDEDNDDAAMFAFPDHVFWTLTGVRLDVAFSEFDTALTANDIAAILEYINHHYQVAFRRNKQSGSHSDFENFVGTRHYLFYYHLWLDQAPHLLNFAVAELPSDVFRESCPDHGGATDDKNDCDDDEDSGNNYSRSTSAPMTKAREGKKNTKKNKAQEKDDNNKSNAQKQLGDALIAFQQAQSQKMKSNRESAGPRRERDLLEVFSEYKSRLKETRLELDTAKKNTATYDSDDSNVVDLKREIALCKKKRDDIFALLSESDLK